MYFNSLLTRLWRHKFGKYSYLSNQAIFSTCPKGQDKNFNIFRTKRAFKMKLKVFFIIFEGLSLKQICIYVFFEGDSLTLSLFYRYDFGRCSSKLAQLVPLPFSRGRSTCYSDRLHDFSWLPTTQMSIFILFESVKVLLEGVFSLWVSLK